MIRSPEKNYLRSRLQSRWLTQISAPYNTTILDHVTGARLSFTNKLDPMSRVTGISGWYWIRGIKCSDTTRVGLAY